MCGGHASNTVHTAHTAHQTENYISNALHDKCVYGITTKMIVI